MANSGFKGNFIFFQGDLVGGFNPSENDHL